MALIWHRGGTGAGTHALLVGVGRYRHLPGGPAPCPALADSGLTAVLRSPAASAQALAGQVIALAGQWRPPLQSVELLVPGRRRSVTRLAIQRAWSRWRRRCDSHPGNLALAWFGGHGLALDHHLLLPEDLGADPLRPWAEAIDLDRSIAGFRRCQAGGQVFWLDLCREVPESLLEQGTAEAQPLESPTRRQVDRRVWGLVLRATGPGAAAWAPAGGAPGRGNGPADGAPSLFTTALLEVLAGAAAVPFRGGWRITCGSLVTAINPLLAALGGPAGQRCEADDLVDGPLLQGPGGDRAGTGRSTARRSRQESGQRSPTRRRRGGATMKNALIVQGGWQGHYPAEVAGILAAGLKERGFAVDIADTLDAYLAPDLSQRDLIVPIWTMGTITKEQLAGLSAAVTAGVGLGGVHGGMCDAFREATEYQFMTGGQWVAHPGNAGVTYTVNITRPDHPICQGVEDFEITSEQYYLHVDPGNEVLATTVFKNNGNVVMPVTWTKTWGAGRVFYCSLGHVPADVELPMANRMILQGLVWAAEGRRA